MSFVDRAVAVANHPYLNGAAVPALFGNGLLGTAVNGLQRIPALLATAAAISILGELAIRGLSNALSAVGFKIEEDTWVGKRCAQITGSGIRPYASNTLHPSTELAWKLLKVAAIGIIGTEIVRILGGQVPPVYNNVLAFFGPIRLSSDSYIGGVCKVISSIRS